MLKLPKKSDLEQLSKEELITEVLRMQRKCNKFSYQIKGYILREEDSREVIAGLRKQVRELGKAYQLNVYLTSTLEFFRKFWGASYMAVDPFRAVNDIEQLSRLHRSDN